MKTLIFDFNGVLANDLRLHEDAYMTLAEKYKLPLTKEQLRAMMHKTSREKIVAITQSKDPKKIDQFLAEKEALYLMYAKQRGVLFPETKDVVDRLSKKYVMAMVTNTTRRQLQMAVPADLLRKFQMILTYEDVKYPKPEPDSLYEVMREMQSSKKDTCYIGDAPSDIQTAHNAGIIGIGITTGYHSEGDLHKAGADLIVHSLIELEKIQFPSLK